MESVSPRAMGTEMEYGLRFAEPEIRRPLSSVLAIYSQNLYYDYLKNGARLYIDLFVHPEYATAECASVMETVAAEIAGEENVKEAFTEAESINMIPKFELNKRLIDSNSNAAWGHHVNLQMKKGLLVSEANLNFIATHLASVTLLTGTGAVVPHQGKSRYVIGQKIRFTEDFKSIASTKGRPLINAKSENHSEGTYDRFHEISGDAPMSPWAMRMKIGTMALVLRLLEEGHAPRPTFGNQQLIAIANRIGENSTLKNRYESLGHNRFSAIDIQQLVLNRIREGLDESTLDDEERWTIQEWQQALDDFRLSQPLEDRIEWVAKLEMIKRAVDRAKCDKDEAARRIDIIWASLGNQGIAKKLRNTIWQEWMPSQELIDSLRKNPPANSRAVARVAIANQLKARKIDFKLGWSSISIGRKEFKLPEPLNPQIPDITQFLLEARVAS